MNFFAQNLRLLRSKIGLNQGELAEKMGWARSTLSSYELETAQPDIDKIIGIARYFNVSIDSLMSQDLTVIANRLADAHLTSKKGDTENGDKSASKPASKPASILSEPTFEYPSRTPKVVTVSDDGKDNVVLVPLRARAGYLAGYEDPEFIETLPTFKLPGFNVGTFRAFEIYGHSMVPTFQESDIIMSRFVENFNEIRDDRVYIIVSKREGVVAKRVINRVKMEGKLILNSDNQRHPGEYPPLIVDPEEILEIWYAVAYFSRQMRSPKEVYNRLNDMEARITFLEENRRKTLE